MPYTRDVTVNPISKGLCRMKVHTLYASSGIDSICCAEGLKLVRIAGSTWLETRLLHVPYKRSNINQE